MCSKDKIQIVVAGGGISGLVYCWKLEQQLSKHGISFEITLLEKNARLGGKIETERYKGIAVERGPDALHMKGPEFISLLDELELKEEMIRPSAGGFFIYQNGEFQKVHEGLLRPFPHNLRAIFLNKDFSLFQKIRALVGGCLPFPSLQKDAPLSRFLRYRFGKRLSQSLFEPLVGGIYGASPDKLSTAYFYSDLWKHRFALPLLVLRIWLRSLFGKRKGRPNFIGMATLRDGLASITSQIEQKLTQTKICTESKIDSVVYHDSKYFLKLSDKSTLVADILCLALPARESFQFVSQLAPELRSNLTDIPYTSSAVCTITLRDANFTKDFLGTGFIIPEEECSAVAACTFTSKKWPGREIENEDILRVFLKERGDFRLTGTPDETIGHIALSTLEKLFKEKLNCTSIHIKRWEKTQPLYFPGYPDLVSQVTNTCQLQFGDSLILLGEIQSSGIPANALTASKSATLTANSIIKRNILSHSLPSTPEDIEKKAVGA